MQVYNQWILCVCSTLTLATIMLSVVPNGNMHRFFKVIISIFIFASFLTPFQSFKYDFDDFKLKEIKDISTDCITDELVERNILIVLEKNDISCSSVECDSHINKNNEIYVDHVQVAVSDKYDLNFVKEVIYKELSLNVSVISIGQ